MSKMQIRGLYFSIIKDVFPQIAEIVGPELGKHFDDPDPDAWYDPAPYIETIAFMRQRISPQVLGLIGNRLAELLEGILAEKGITTPKDLGDRVMEIYSSLIRGEDAGEWVFEERRPGRAVLRETGPSRSTSFVTGILKGGLEAVGAYNVRVTVLDDCTAGAPANRYLIEWIDPNPR